MLDIQFIRENQEAVRQAALHKNLPDVTDELLTVDQKRRELKKKADDIRSQRNQLMAGVYGKPSDEVIAQGKALKEELAHLEPELKKVEEEYTRLMLLVPNVPRPEVPVAPDPSGNVEVASWGEKPQFDFEAKDHVELAKTLQIIDFDRGTKVAGTRGYFLKNDGVLLHLGVLHFALRFMAEKGFQPIIPPTLLNERPFINTGHFPWGKDDAYKTHEDVKETDAKFLAGTSEVPLISYHMDETFSYKNLPLCLSGFSQCYRREVGSYGKDTAGVYRIHEFSKIEQIVICEADWNVSGEWHEKLRSYAEEILQQLGLPYRVMLMCTGDMGEPHAKKYDIETWMPGRNAYGETMSDSMMGDFQARRANIKYQTATGETRFAHTLNNTAIASPRILIAILENFQQADGSVVVPEVLRSFVGKDRLEPEQA